MKDVYDTKPIFILQSSIRFSTFTSKGWGAFVKPDKHKVFGLGHPSGTLNLNFRMSAMKNTNTVFLAKTSPGHLRGPETI